MADTLVLPVVLRFGGCPVGSGARAAGGGGGISGSFVLVLGVCACVVALIGVAAAVVALRRRNRIAERTPDAASPPAGPAGPTEVAGHAGRYLVPITHNEEYAEGPPGDEIAYGRPAFEEPDHEHSVDYECMDGASESEYGVVIVRPTSTTFLYDNPDKCATIDGAVYELASA